jgi:hypothetical protein
VATDFRPAVDYLTAPRRYARAPDQPRAGSQRASPCPTSSALHLVFQNEANASCRTKDSRLTDLTTRDATCPRSGGNIEQPPALSASTLSHLATGAAEDGGGDADPSARGSLTSH